ncbi:hypothetical protein [Sutcliffiella horikoshii]|uniref:hypothetical protein n=1 Tax=Sutcliffiella horikoshii TaxID=79883 RepID=UPI001CFEF1C1|nr:hypothetical protein [Sutcliffiella horikoshii]
MIFGTVSCTDHLHLAINLAKSVKQFHPESIFIICLVETYVHELAYQCESFDQIILANQLGNPDVDNNIKKYNRYEGAISVRGHFFNYLINSFPNHSKFIYLDPDMKIFSALDEVNELLDTHHMILTPHLLTPCPLDLIDQFEIHHLTYGTYNLGFFAFTRSDESKRYINWITKRLDKYCFEDLERGLFVDQKWVDAAPCFFDIYILKHPGYNVAFWNLYERKIEKSGGQLIVNKLPLRCFHFSHTKRLASTINSLGNNKIILSRIFNEYINDLVENGQYVYEKIPWSYD